MGFAPTGWGVVWINKEPPPPLQSWSGWVACPCDVEVASPGPHLPRRAQRQALQPPCRGLEHQAHTSPRQRRTTMEQAGVPQPSPPPLRHTRAHTHRHGGISRPRAPPRGLGAVNSPVGLVTGHPGTAAQSGPAGKAARTVGRRPGEALTQPNPTQPPLQRPKIPKVPTPLGVTSHTAASPMTQAFTIHHYS